MESVSRDFYTRTAVLLHWTIAAIMIINVLLGWSFESLAEPYLTPAGNTHKTLGILAVGLVLLRILWRLGHRPPEFSASKPQWQRRVARFVHFGLYVVILVMPVSGWIYFSAWEWASSYPISVFGLFEMPALAPIVNLSADVKHSVHDWADRFHHWFAYPLYALFVIHLAGAIKGQWLDRDGTLARMRLRRSS